MCYELVTALADGFSEDEELTEDEVGEKTIASLVFYLFHEVGHAAIDVFDLPITGNAEDTVDRFATLIHYLVGDNGLPEERAEACPNEYEKIPKS